MSAPESPSGVAPAAVPVRAGAVEADAEARMGRLRTEIERIDREIVALIGARARIAREVGPLKRARGMPLLDPPREAAVVRRAGALASSSRGRWC